MRDLIPENMATVADRLHQVLPDKREIKNPDPGEKYKRCGDQNKGGGLNGKRRRGQVGHMEKKIIALAKGGLGTNSIAKQLGVNKSTVLYHMRKLRGER